MSFSWHQRITAGSWESEVRRGPICPSAETLFFSAIKSKYSDIFNISLYMSYMFIYVIYVYMLYTYFRHALKLIWTVCEINLKWNCIYLWDLKHSGCLRSECLFWVTVTYWKNRVEALGPITCMSPNYHWIPSHCGWRILKIKIQPKWEATAIQIIPFTHPHYSETQRAELHGPLLQSWGWCTAAGSIQRGHRVESDLTGDFSHILLLKRPSF